MFGLRGCVGSFGVLEVLRVFDSVVGFFLDWVLGMAVSRDIVVVYLL